MSTAVLCAFLDLDTHITFIGHVTRNRDTKFSGKIIIIIIIIKRKY